MMTLPTGRRIGARPPGLWAFTLIELILVMSLMVMLLALLAPSLGNFFRGRTLDSEARRFMSLARYGRSRAISEGIPMVLWLDPDRRAYGLTEEFSYLDRDEKAIRYQLEEDVQLEVDRASVGLVSTRRVPVIPSTLGLGPNALAIRFEPDGFVSEESPTSLRFRQRARDGQLTADQKWVWITQDQQRITYELQTNELAYVRR
jgi:hypothetical protein